MAEIFYDRAIKKMDDDQKNEIIKKALIDNSTSLVEIIGAVSNVVKSSDCGLTNYTRMYNERQDKMVNLGIWRQEYDDAFELAMEGDFGEEKIEELYKIILEEKR